MHTLTHTHIHKYIQHPSVDREKEKIYTKQNKQTMKTKIFKEKR